MPAAINRWQKGVPGNHWALAEPPTATFTNPIGTSSTAVQQSPTGGQIEPRLLPSTTGCGSWATRQAWALKSSATMCPAGSSLFNSSSLLLAAYD